MTIANCKRCGRIFSRVRRDICVNCVAEEDRAFQLVREYLREHRDSDMNQIVEATGVLMEDIVQMIQDGRLILLDNPNLKYGCARCGKPTQSGRYCSDCSKKLARDLQIATDDLKSKAIKGKIDNRGFYSR